MLLYKRTIASDSCKLKKRKWPAKFELTSDVENERNVLRKLCLVTYPSELWNCKKKIYFSLPNWRVQHAETAICEEANVVKLFKYEIPSFFKFSLSQEIPEQRSKMKWFDQNVGQRIKVVPALKYRDHYKSSDNTQWFIYLVHSWCTKHSRFPSHDFC